jgi:pSer/pThr/pTyr-binding forkhead associated (FHA) protein
MAEKKVAIYKNFKLPQEVGTHYRLVCLTGQKKGDVYYLRGDRVIMGRGETADIQVLDMKSSREHAEIKKVGPNLFITDLGSQNGLVVNDLKVTQTPLEDGDRVIIGQTVYKFSQVSVDKLQLDRKNDSQKFDNNQDNNEEDAEKKKKKNKNVLTIGGIIILIVFFFLDSGTPKKGPAKKKVDSPQDISEEFKKSTRKKKNVYDKEMEEKLKNILQRGLRESREGNYFRAIDEFNLALILSPQNSRASFYREKTIQLLNEEIEGHFIQARKSFDSIKYEQAITAYCSIIRLLQNLPEDDRYKIASDNLKQIEIKLGLDEGEIKCLQE